MLTCAYRTKARARPPKIAKPLVAIFDTAPPVLAGAAGKLVALDDEAIVWVEVVWTVESVTLALELELDTTVEDELTAFVVEETVTVDEGTEEVDVLVDIALAE